MKLKLYILIGITLMFQQVKAQEFHYYTYEVIRDTVRDTIKQYDTIVVQPKLDSILKHFNLSFDDFLNTFKNYIAKHKKNGESQYPSEDDIYLNYLLSLYLEENVHKRYFMKVYFESDNGDSIDLSNMNLPIHPNLSTDVLLVIEGEKNTDNFLHSPNNQNKTIFKVLKDVSTINKKNKKRGDDHFKKVGLNIYFPDFTFNEKREMAQFIKSVSLIIDSINNPDLRDIPLYFTFDKNAEKEHFAFLVGLSDMADSIFLVNNQALTNFEAIDKHADISKIEKVKNQFYLARFYTDEFPITSDEVNKNNIGMLMKADYPNSWEIYFIGILVIIFLLLLGIICYFSLSLVANFIHENYMYIFAGIIILVAEIILLFVFMIEEMNSHTKVFNLWEILIVLTLIVFFIPLIKKVIKEKKTP